MIAAAPLAPREAYRRRAPAYHEETAVSHLEDVLVRALTPDVRGLRVLDAGCGTGRRLRALDGASLAAGADLTPEMLAAGRGGAAGPAVFAAADVRALPFASAAFDVVWCRLVIGHVADVDAVYAELGRVAALGATVIVTDFHPEAARAGHVRSFRDVDGVVREIEHHLHEPADHLRAAAAAGLTLVTARDGEVGPEIEPFYARAGKLDRYAADRGLPVVLALSFRR